jgi:hypothetical protein
MNKADAAAIIETIRQSLERDPQQFHLNIEVTMIGYQSTSHGGIGTNVSAIGGGPGSSTTGLNVSVSTDNAQIKIANQQGVDAMNTQYIALLNTLSQISDELRVPAPDGSKIAKLSDSLKEHMGARGC